MFAELAGYVPLGILGLVRWLSWVVRRLPASLYRPVVNDHTEPLSIVVPVYQEDPTTLRHALASWIANDVAEIICVVDVTDERCMRICREAGVTVIATAVPGKRDALRRGWERASTPLVALVDSDTIWAHDVAAHVCMPFVDPAVGAVGTRQNVSRPRTVWEHINDLYLDYRYFDEIASQTVAGRAVSVVSGRTAVYRRDLLLAASERFMGERFLGRTILSGDDKRLTTLVLEGGHRTVLQRSARVWSDFPRRPRQFFVQRLRWARNTWRSDLRALGSRWVWRHPFLAFSMIDKAISPFTLLVSPVYFALALARGDTGIALALVVWWIVSRSAKALPHLDRKPHHMLTLMPVFIPVTFVMALVKIWALCTIRTSGWMTRDVAVGEDGTVTRTGMADATAPVVITVPDPEPVPHGDAVPARQAATVAGRMPASRPALPEPAVRALPATTGGVPAVGVDSDHALDQVADTDDDPVEGGSTPAYLANPVPMPEPTPVDTDLPDRDPMLETPDDDAAPDAGHGTDDTNTGDDATRATGTDDGNAGVDDAPPATGAGGHAHAGTTQAVDTAPRVPTRAATALLAGPAHLADRPPAGGVHLSDGVQLAMDFTGHLQGHWDFSGRAAAQGTHGAPGQDARGRAAAQGTQGAHPGHTAHDARPTHTGAAYDRRRAS